MDDRRTDPGTAVRELVHGRWKAQAVAAALRLGLPELLEDGEVAASDLARALGADRDGLRRLLALLAALGIFERTGPDRYRANEASRLLRSDHPGSLRAEALHVLSGWAAIAWDGLERSVREGGPGLAHRAGVPLFEHLRRHPEEAAAFHAFQAVQAGRAAARLVGVHPFPAAGTVVDVGGGTGTLMAHVLGHRPGLRGILLDRPEVIEEARAALAAGGLGDRVELRAGSFFDPLPAGADVYLLAHVLHDWPDAGAARILGRVAGAMAGSSVLVVLEHVPDPASPSLVAAYLDVLMLAATGGRERPLADHQALLQGAGLRLTRCRHLDPSTGLTAMTARLAGR